MEIKKSSVVMSTSGRDKGNLFLVLETDDNFVYLVDGRVRRYEKPKRKNRRHLALYALGGHPICEKILAGERLTNPEIRRALAEICDSQHEEG